MKNFKKKLFGVEYSIVDYKAATNIIIKSSIEKRSLGCSALAVHGLMTSVSNPELKKKLNKIELIVPDGQPIKWALNHFHKVNLKDRVYGPTLTLHVLEEAHRHSLNVFLYGSTEKTLRLFSNFIQTNYSNVNICGIHVDRFRDATEQEDKEDIAKIKSSNADIVLVGRGCPRQEEWVANHIDKIFCPMLAVGAAFDFHAGLVKQAPKWMQDFGLEWLYRLIQEPTRLWKRYLFTNTHFIVKFLIYKLTGKYKK